MSAVSGDFSGKQYNKTIEVEIDELQNKLLGVVQEKLKLDKVNEALKSCNGLTNKKSLSILISTAREQYSGIEEEKMTVVKNNIHFLVNTIKSAGLRLIVQYRLNRGEAQAAIATSNMVTNEIERDVCFGKCAEFLLENNQIDDAIKLVPMIASEKNRDEMYSSLVLYYLKNADVKNAVEMRNLISKGNTEERKIADGFIAEKKREFREKRSV